jgi:hypothetical protein
MKKRRYCGVFSSAGLSCGEASDARSVPKRSTSTSIQASIRGPSFAKITGTVAIVRSGRRPSGIDCARDIHPADI